MVDRIIQSGLSATATPEPATPVELKPGQTRKETEGVFILRDGKAAFVPISVGIAGERYFEILKGLKARYEEHHGIKYQDEALRTAAELGQDGSNRSSGKQRGVFLQDVQRILDEHKTDAITINQCMGTIMPMSETTACMPLSSSILMAVSLLPRCSVVRSFTGPMLSWQAMSCSPMPLMPL